MTYSLMIETDAGTYQHGYHLGTIEATARRLAEEIRLQRRPKIGNRIVRVALMTNRGNDLVDVFDGIMWANDRHDD